MRPRCVERFQRRLHVFPLHARRSRVGGILRGAVREALVEQGRLFLETQHRGLRLRRARRRGIFGSEFLHSKAAVSTAHARAVRRLLALGVLVKIILQFLLERAKGIGVGDLRFVAIGFVHRPCGLQRGFVFLAEDRPAVQHEVVEVVRRAEHAGWNILVIRVRICHVHLKAMLRDRAQLELDLLPQPQIYPVLQLFAGGRYVDQAAKQTTLRVRDLHLLVEVDVEIGEVRNFAALGSAQAVIGKIAHETQQFLFLAVAGSARQSLELLNGNDLADVQRGLELVHIVINAAAVHVTGKQHHVYQVRRAPEVGRSGTLVLFARIKQGLNDRFGVNVILTKVGRGIRALQTGLHGRDVDIRVKRIQFVVGPDGANLGRIDLAVGAFGATIANQNRGRKLLVQIHAVDVVHVLNNVEILDVDNIIAVKLALDVDGLRISGARQQTQVTAKALLLALLITCGTQSADVPHIRLAGANSRNRALMYLLKYLRNPALIVRQQLWSAGADILVFGEQRRDAVKAKIGVSQIVTSLIGVQFQRRLPAADAAALCGGKDSLLIGVAESRGLGVGFRIKHVVLHVFILLFSFVGVGFVRFLFNRFFQNGIHDELLLVRHRIEDIADSLVVFIVLVIILVIVLVIFLSGRVRMNKAGFDRFAGIKDTLLAVFFDRSVAVNNGGVDHGSHCRIRPSRLGGGSSRRACGGSGCSESQAYSGEGEFREPARGRRCEIRKRRSREQGCAARMGRDGAKRLVRRAQGRAGGVDFGQVCGSRRR